MEILGERPAWSMNDSEKLSCLDATVAVLGSLTTYYLHLIADLDASGYAKDVGAGDTARFLSGRYLIDASEARRDVRVAKALGKYSAVSAALPDPAHPFPETEAAATANAAEVEGEDATDDPAEEADGGDTTRSGSINPACRPRRS